MCTRFDSEVNSHTSTRKLVTTLVSIHPAMMVVEPLEFP